MGLEVFVKIENCRRILFYLYGDLFYEVDIIVVKIKWKVSYWSLLFCFILNVFYIYFLEVF